MVSPAIDASPTKKKKKTSRKRRVAGHFDVDLHGGGQQGERAKRSCPGCQTSQHRLHSPNLPPPAQPSPAREDAYCSPHPPNKDHPLPLLTPNPPFQRRPPTRPPCTAAAVKPNFHGRPVPRSPSPLGRTRFEPDDRRGPSTSGHRATTWRRVVRLLDFGRCGWSGKKNTIAFDVFNWKL